MAEGKKLDVKGYIRWVEQWHRHPGFDWCLIPDVIEGSESENDHMIAIWPMKDIGVPVWHLHEPIDRLVKLCAQFLRVAFGSSGAYSTPGSRQWWTRMADALDAICDDDGHPPCKLHGLRMMDPEIFTHIPFASVDSTNAAQNNGALRRFGSYVPPSASQRAAVIADRIEMHNSAPVWIRSLSQASFALLEQTQ